MRRLFPALALLAALLPGGCVERFISVKTEPPGATVYLDDQKAGETPLEIPYTWYGKRRLAVERPGFTGIHEIVALNPPWWQYFPLDFVTDVLLPFRLEDRSEFDFALERAAVSDKELEEVKARAAELRKKAEGEK